MLYQEASIWSDDGEKVKVYKLPDMCCEEYWYIPRWAVVDVVHRGFVWTHISSGHFEGYIKTKHLEFFMAEKECFPMEIIQDLSDFIDEEIGDATKYAKYAISIRDQYPVVADSLMKISDEEMKHMAMLHSDVVAVIEDYRKTNGEPPEAMKILYNILHKKHINHAAEAKAYQTMYKGG